MDKFVTKRGPPPPDSSSTPPPKKKSKPLTKFRDDYTKEWPFLKSSCNGETYAHCVPCNINFSVGSGGRVDIQKHLKTKKHEVSMKSGEKSVSIGTFFAKDKDLSVIRSEVRVSQFLVDNNLPIAISDKFGNLLREVCPDSEIAKKYACARTKTTAIVGCLGRHVTQELVENMKTTTFSLGTDGSNDHHSKLYPIVVFINDETSERVSTQLLSVPELPLEQSSTAANITELMKSELAKHNIPLTNCIAFMSDNANVMIGKKGGVSTLLKKEQPNLLSIGCGCHLINLALKKSVSELPFKVDEFLIDIYYYFQHSEKKLAEFNEFQELYSNEAKQILKYCPTRWLCLTTSLRRAFELWKPMTKYFNKVKEESESKKKKNQETKKVDPAGSIIESWFQNGSTSAAASSADSTPDSKPTDRLDRIVNVLNSKKATTYCAFLLWVVPIFDKYNKILQSEEPQIHKLKQLYVSMFRDLLMKFVKPEVIKLNSPDITKVKFTDTKIHIPNEKLYCGDLANGLLEKTKAKLKDGIHSNIKAFYTTALQYMLDKFPLQEDALHHAQFVNVERRDTALFESVSYFIKKLPHLSISMDTLQMEFTDFQCADLPASILCEPRSDKQWNMLLHHTNMFDKSKPFHNLAMVALSVLSIPHSNASAERVFSIVKKNRNDVRSSMSTETMNSLLVTKLRTGPLALSDQLLRKCKAATKDSLQASSSL